MSLHLLLSYFPPAYFLIKFLETHTVVYLQIMYDCFQNMTFLFHAILIPEIRC
jgi:hypothetical protein